MVRAFVAIEVGAAPAPGSAPPAPDHLTLAFLGEVPPTTTVELVERLRPAARATAPFVLTVEGVGAFPSERAPRVVWLGVTRGREEVTELARKVREALSDLVALPKETFVPHITWFRVRSEAGRRAAREVLEGKGPPPPTRTVTVREFHLKESQLGYGGAVHRSIAVFPLEGADRSPPS